MIYIFKYFCSLNNLLYETKGGGCMAISSNYVSFDEALIGEGC